MSFAPLDDDCAGAEEGSTERGRMGARMRMVKWGLRRGAGWEMKGREAEMTVGVAAVMACEMAVARC